MLICIIPIPIVECRVQMSVKFRFFSSSSYSSFFLIQNQVYICNIGLLSELPTAS